MLGRTAPVEQVDICPLDPEHDLFGEVTAAVYLDARVAVQGYTIHRTAKTVTAFRYNNFFFNDNFINQFLKIHFNMSKKCSIYLKCSVLQQNVIIIITIIIF